MTMNRSLLFYICLVFSLLICGGLCGDVVQYGYLGAHECKNFGHIHSIQNISGLEATRTDSGLYVCNENGNSF